MNSNRNMKNHRENPKNVDENPEVLVLPPRALLEFGISLGDIGKFLNAQKSSSEGGPSQHVVEIYDENDTSNISLDVSQCNLNESSIMKTASLMKNSLFLSPTFSNLNLIDSTLNKEAPPDSISDLDINNSDHGKKDDVNFFPQLNLDVLLEKKSKAKDQEQRPLEHKEKNEINSEQVGTINKAHHINELVSNKSKGLNILNSDITSFIPVSNNKIINLKLKSADEKEIKNTNVSTSKSVHRRKKSKRVKISEMVIINNETNPQDVKIIEDNEKDIVNSQLGSEADSNISDKVNFNGAQNSDINDSVSRVAKFLKEYLQNKKDVNVKHTLQCKSHIQGVEKPGGEIECKFFKLKKEKHPKMYSIKARSDISEKNEIVSNSIEQTKIDYNINLIEKVEVNKAEMFCVCSDFGSYNYYGDAYQHIHYWEQRNSKCSIDDIFSIYCDDHSNGINNRSSYKEAVSDKSECDYICINEEIELTSRDDCRNKMASTSIEIEVPICCGDHMTLEENDKDNISEGKRNCEAQKNIPLKMQNVSVLVTPDSLRKQKRKSKRHGTDASPKNKKTRKDAGIKEPDANNDSVELSQNTNSLPDVSVKDPSKIEKPDVICAVCHKNIADSKWYEHTARKHSYLAWKEGEKPIDVTKTEEVKEHLLKMLERFGVLICGRCGVERNDITKYLSHVNSCNGEPAPLVVLDMSKSLDTVKCATCEQDVSDWYNHIGSAHDYLAYKEGETPVDFTDESEVRKHLSAISKEYNGLECSKCGCRRQFVKAFLNHMKKCDAEPGDSFDNTISSVKCGVCQEEILEDFWIQHIEQEHDYMAWELGETPFDVNDPEAVYSHLYNVLKKIDCLVCTKCGCKRKYVKGYLTHFNQCTSKTGYTPDKRRFSAIKRKKAASVICSFDESSTVTCGVCGVVKSEIEWLDHIEQEHQYLAWKFGDPPLDLNNTRAITSHLNNISSHFIDGFLCSKCGKRRKCSRIYYKHVLACDGDLSRTNDSLLNESILDTSSNLEKSVIKEKQNVTCGVCNKNIDAENWFQHISEEHNYLAWKSTDEPLDLSDTMALRDYLYNITQMHGQLTCKTCGAKRKYSKSFLAHISVCDPSVIIGSSTPDTSMSTSFQEDANSDITIKCGVCRKEMENREWEIHIRVHNYIAWKEGHKPLDTNDEQAVYAYLYDLSKTYDGLTCAKCNVKKKYVKAYRGHVATCHGNIDVESVIQNQKNRETYECAICKKTGPVNKFKSHAMSEHYNVAWMVGDIPIDVKTTSSVEKYLKEYQKSHSSLVCNKCGQTRASLAGFFAHVVQCGRTEEETEMYKSVCEICNTKYLGVYKHTHMAIHRLEEARKKHADKVPEVANETSQVTGKRRAAQKAQNVIKNITKVTEKDTEGDAEEEGEYKCSEESSSSESEESGVSETEDQPQTEIEEESSDTESRVRQKKSTSTFSTANHDRIPFDVKDPSTYIAKSFKDFTNTNLTSNTLFPQWLSCEYESVLDADLLKYMPPLTESCQVQFCSKMNSTYKVFEAKADKGVSLFVGASINNMSWVPCNNGQAHPYLAVNCYNGTDAPRIDANEVLAHSGLIQIWDFKDMHNLPSFVFGLAHDFGTVWGMEWCPSGACELLPESPKGFVRLGLLAVACSNGMAYIYSVPHPAIIKTDTLVYKLKPVAEMRLFRDMNKKVQATAVTWSAQKGHTNVIIGYSNGMTAMYNLECDSPLLSCEENGVKVFYPYYDEQTHNVCVTDVKAFVSGSNICGSVSASPCGVTASLASGRLHVPLIAERLLITPHWPSTILAGNSDIINQAVNEVQWWGNGRRLGSMSTACGCMLCGRLAAYFPPLIKTMLLHPTYNDRRDIQIKAKIDIVPINTVSLGSPNKVKEPESYQESIKMYGIKFDLATNLNKNERSQNINKPKPRNAERYPLADVTAVAFCTIPKYHKRLAIATHCGIVFVINT